MGGRRFEPRLLAKAFSVLAEADLELKGSKKPPELVLEGVPPGTWSFSLARGRPVECTVPEGGEARVFRFTDAAGRQLALKVFHELSSDAAARMYGLTVLARST